MGNKNTDWIKFEDEKPPHEVVQLLVIATVADGLWTMCGGMKISNVG